jgi:hypothetical protein
MALHILGADNPSEMEEISQKLSENKFKVMDHQDNFILMKRRRYGNVLIHAVCLIVALMYFSLAIFINVIYFTYSFIWASPTVLITTETVDDEGKPLEYSDMDEILKEATRLI